MYRAYHFVGGPQDGKVLQVPGTVASGTELLVRPGEPYLPWEPYGLQEDGRFHYLGYISRSDARRRVATEPEPVGT